MKDNRFVFDRALPAGRVVFKVTNDDHLPHRLTVLPLADDLPPLDAQLHGDTRRAAAPFAGLPSQAPGSSDSFAVDLQPGGRYGFICFLQDADGISHALKGMNADLRAAGPGPS